MLVQLKDKKMVNLFLVTVFYLLIIELVAFQFYYNVKGLLTGIVSSYKLSFCLLFYCLIEILIQSKRISVVQIIRYFINSASIYAIIILVSNILGINFGVYGDDLGSKGVFTSANGLGIFIGVAGLFSLYSYLTNRSKIEIIRLCLFLYVLANLMSKAAIILAVCVILLLFFYMKNRYKVAISLLALCFVTYYQSYIVEFISSTISVISYNYEHSDDFLSFILSGRVWYLEYAFEHYSLSYSLFYRLFLGMGYFVSFRNPYMPDFWKDSSCFLECELFDMFFMYGLVGLLFYLFLFFYGLKKAFQMKGKYTNIFLISWIVLFFHSAFAGHVFFNGMSIIAFVTILIVLNNHSVNNEDFISVT